MSNFVFNIAKGRVRYFAEKPNSVNIVTNPSFETNTTGWTGAAAGWDTTTISRSSTRSKDGDYCCQVVYPTSVNGATGLLYAFSATAGVTYTCSAYVYVATGNPDVTPSIYGLASGSNCSTKDAWTRVSITYTAVSTATHYFAIQNTVAGSYVSGNQFFVDAAQVELGYFPTPFQPAATDGHKLLLFKTVVADATLADYSTLAQITAANTEASAAGYSRKAVTVTYAQDNSGETYGVYFPAVTWSSVAAGDDLKKAVLVYDPNTASSTDSLIVPLLAWDFVWSTNGGDVIANPPAGNLVFQES